MTGPETPPPDQSTGPTEPVPGAVPAGGGAPPGGGGSPGGGEPAGGGPRRLARSSTDRVLGGVSGGLGRYFDVDPVLFRLAFVVLTLVGGAGAIAYLGAWLVLPSDDAAPGERSSRTRALLLVGAGVLVLVAVPVLGPGILFGGALLPLALLALLVFALVRVARGGDAGDAGRVLARVALALLVVVVGIAAVLGVGAVAALGGGVVMAALLVAAGVALVVGAFVGGARWLIVPALLLALPVGVVAAADLDVDGGVGERRYAPATLGELRDGYELGMGEMIVDLRDLDLPAGRTDVRVDMGLGAVSVWIPDDACVSSDIRVGAGAADVLDRENAGLDVVVREQPSSPPATPRLHLDAEIGMGAIEVVRGVTGSEADDGRWDGRDWDWDDPRNTNAACASA